MAWFGELADKAEHLLKRLDVDQTGAMRSYNNAMKQNKRISSPSGLTLSEAMCGPKKRPIPRGFKKLLNTPDSVSNSGLSKKSTVPVYNLAPKDSETPKCQNCAGTKVRKSPTKLCHLNHSPKTLPLKMDDFSDSTSRHRRSCLPSKLEYSAAQASKVSHQIENIEMENTLLKTEVSSMGKQITDLAAKLTQANEELRKADGKAERAAALYAELTHEKNMMSEQLLQLKNQVAEFTTNELQEYKNQIREMETENAVLRDRIKEMEQKITKLNGNIEDQETMYLDLENQLHLAKNNISNLQNSLEESKQERNRIETDWETYKIRVKSMIAEKDKEIKALQNGLKLSEDTRALFSQIDNLKAERTMLSDAIMRLRCECEDMKQYMETLDSRHRSAERVVVALRDALRDERAARHRAETQANSLAKELKSIQIEMGQTIASLRTALHDKEQEKPRLPCSSSSFIRTSTSSALNVADYGGFRDTESSVDEDEVSRPSHIVMQRKKVENQMADNNTVMKMAQSQRPTTNKPTSNENGCETARDGACTPRRNPHVLEHSQNGTQILNRNQITFGLNKLWRRIGSEIKALPALRMCVIFYMVFLQIWVATVLYSNIDYKSKQLPNAEKCV